MKSDAVRQCANQFFRTVLSLSFLALWEVARATQAVVPTADYRADQILVQPKAGAAAALQQFHTTRGAMVAGSFPDLAGLQVVRLPVGETVAGFIAKCEQSGLVEFAEPDYLLHAALTPNDPKYLDGTLWGLHNTGQAGGTLDADIDAPEGWDVRSSASNIVVAVLDTGIRLTHEDLATNIWTSPYDGWHGLNAFTGTNNVDDDNGHGTLMAGVTGAAGNNGKGVTGVAWRVQLMAGKCLDAGGNGSDSTLIACIDYARTNGAHIINASLDGPGFSLAVSNAIFATRTAGITFVSSAGNNSANIDPAPRYPSCYGIDNIVSVAYTTRTDALGFLSNYGATNVDLAAPGDQIYSTYRNSDASYYPPFDFINVAGTSYAAAYVSGALALMRAKFPAESHQEIITRLLNATDPLPGLAGKCLTGGRLNLRKALSPPIRLTPISNPGVLPFTVRVAGGPNRTCVLEASETLNSWTPIFTNTTAANGSFDYADPQSNGSAWRFLRAVAAP